MRILIIEDEATAANRLEQLIYELYPNYKILAKLSSIKDSVEWLPEHEVDLIFLDIQLSDGISFTIFEQLDVQTPIIFTTAYQEYALKAFSVNSISYLLKPINKKELKLSIDKLKELTSVLTVDFHSLFSILKDSTDSYKHRFIIKIGEQLKMVISSEIAFFFAQNKAVYLKTFAGKLLPIEYTLEQLEDEVDPSLFFRINRACIININAINKMYSYSKTRIKLELTPQVLKEEHSIVSVNRTTTFKRWINS
ncbi:MAG: response regulator transcription factor [Balneolaceae bacterium]|nr:response regulator transcription factor [Balneolaceae bacterium]